MEMSSKSDKEDTTTKSKINEKINKQIILDSHLKD